MTRYYSLYCHLIIHYCVLLLSRTRIISIRQYYCVDAFVLHPSYTSNSIIRRNDHRTRCRIRMKNSGSQRKHYPLQSIDEDNDNESSASDPSLQCTSTTNNTNSSRRQALSTILASTAAATAFPLMTKAALPEVDPSGELFSPRDQMMGGGGSDAARGMKLREPSSPSRIGRKGGMFGGGGGPVQDVYEVRFIAYLSRFLLNYDPAAMIWWDGQIEDIVNGSVNDGKKGSKAKREKELMERKKLRFAEFAESVEVGLADYFVGAYGSYDSVPVANTGINVNDSTSSPNFLDLFGDEAIIRALRKTPNDYDSKSKSYSSSSKSSSTSTTKKKRLTPKQKEELRLKRQGVSNLFALLAARYASEDEKRQLAILFSLFSNPSLQPTAAVRSLLAELDDASVTAIEWLPPATADYISRKYGGSIPLPLPTPSSGMIDRNFQYYGGGYMEGEIPTVAIEAPPPFGNAYRPANISPIMRCTSRVLRIRVIDGGSGYIAPPTVKVIQDGVKRECEACAILTRKGQVCEILILNPGLGYGSKNGITVPEVRVSKPRRRGAVEVSSAKAVADLEWAIADFTVNANGNGYIATEPPIIKVSPPAVVPDWYVDQKPRVNAQVSKMTYVRGGVSVTFSTDEVERQRVMNMLKSDVGGISGKDLSDALQIERCLGDDPLALLPSDIRPTFTPPGESIPVGGNNIVTAGKSGYYRIPNLYLLTAPSIGKLPSAQYRAIDPIFGGVGRKPVTKGAQSLTSSEYTRLALSGAVCTVIVRTALNPLELLKTKLQLGNDQELIRFALENDDNDHGGGDGGNVKEKQRTLSPTKKHNSGESKNIAASTTNKPHVTDDNSSVLTQATTIPTTEGEEDEKVDSSTISAPILAQSLITLRGPSSLFQSADITFLASVIFGGLGFGATELFRRYFVAIFFDGGSSGGNGGAATATLLLAAGLATVVTSFCASPFELMRIKSMAYLESQPVKVVFSDFLKENRKERNASNPKHNEKSPSPSNDNIVNDDDDNHDNSSLIGLTDLQKEDLKPLFSGFLPIVSREFPFAVTKFLAFDLIASTTINIINSLFVGGAEQPVEVGIGTVGLIVSAASGSVAGVFSAFISHPADLILTLTSGSKDKAADNDENNDSSSDWKVILDDLLAEEGGIKNLYTGFSARATFFFLVIGLQFFLYDYTKNIFQVSSDDLTLVLDVFYAIRQGLVNMDST